MEVETTEYKKFVAERVKKSNEDIKNGRLFTSEEFYERAMSAIANSLSSRSTTD
ncbi:hypothetical protein [Testudinibacter aquarius]|uniref:Uncharacterized protein n=1 Tax=Testudinibacter aquarius TaxID=1524974 RepID=A0A4R3YAT5_9PAST|nr:hypothetical protein [Testudinibacter aquarius]TCV88872.1 hypothetical protein EDC16_103227 [Testudinibacter aquarius]